MNTAVWIVQVLAALAFVGAGILKTTQPHAKIAEVMTWAKDYSAQNVKLIGLAELLGGIGLIVPALTRILPILTPIAAVCLAIIMLGAIYTHIRLHETAKSIAPLVLLLLVVFVAYGRFIAVPLS